MRHAVYNFLLHFALFYSQFDFSNAEPLFGENIRVAKENEFPFVVSIGNKVNDVPVENSFCTGALISKRHVLTAEHCSINETIDDLQVTVGSIDVRGGTKYGVRSLITYNDWAAERKQRLAYKVNDIAILTLSEDVKDPNAKVGVLSPTKLPELRGTNAIVAGWGVSNKGTIPRYMETVKLKVLTVKDCMDQVKLATGKRMLLTMQVYLCTMGTPFALIQDGDSGGPIFDENHDIIGINESTIPIDVTDNPDVVNLHLSVDFYRNFITDVIQSS